MPTCTNGKQTRLSHSSTFSRAATVARYWLKYSPYFVLILLMSSSVMMAGRSVGRGKRGGGGGEGEGRGRKGMCVK